MSPPLVQPRWGQPVQKVGQFFRSISRFGLKLFSKKIVKIVIFKFFCLFIAKVWDHPSQMVGQ